MNNALNDDEWILLANRYVEALDAEDEEALSLVNIEVSGSEKSSEHLINALLTVSKFFAENLRDKLLDEVARERPNEFVDADEVDPFALLRRSLFEQMYNQ